jgi:imidazoleglycerol phosphate synthase glutamine amidotransferase subunit HisH
VLGTTELDGRRFASVAGAGRVAGTQFHPEKSGPAGRDLLRAFLRWSGDAA